MTPNPPKSQDSKPEPRPKDAEKPVDPNTLSEEQQMALYEEDLKESDWGHQPC